MASHSGDPDDAITGINVTPLVDVVLVLLVVLMVTAHALATRSLALDLPTVSRAESRPRRLEVSVDRAGTLHLDGRPVDDAELAAAARALAGPGASAAVAADAATAHRHVVHTIDVLRRAGVSQVALAVIERSDAP